MEILLNRGELLDLGVNLQGLTVHCRSGVCWLTQAKDSRDHILRAGQCYQVTRRGRLLVTATDRCSLQLIAPPAAAKLTIPWQQLSCSN